MLTVASDKQRGILGKCELDLAEFDYEDFRIHRIDLNECQYEGAWVEVGLKASEAMRSSNRNNLNQSQRSMAATSQAADAISQSDSGVTMTEANYRELLDKFADMKKQKRTAETEKLKEKSQLESKNNQLQTDFENAKVSRAGADKKAKLAQEEVDQVTVEIENRQTMLNEK